MALKSLNVSPEEHSDMLKHIAKFFDLPPRETIGKPITCEEGYRKKIRCDTFEIGQCLFHLFFDEITIKYKGRRRRGTNTLWQSSDDTLVFLECDSRLRGANKQVLKTRT